MTAKLYEDKVSGTINSDTFAILIQKSEQERIQKAIRLEALLAEERKARQEVEKEKTRLHPQSGHIPDNIL